MHSPACISTEVMPLKKNIQRGSRTLHEAWPVAAPECRGRYPVNHPYPVDLSLQGVLPMSSYFLSQANFLHDSTGVSSCSSEITVLYDVRDAMT